MNAVFESVYQSSIPLRGLIPYISFLIKFLGCVISRPPSTTYY